MNYYHNNRYYTKVIPKEFRIIPNLGDFLEDLEHKRLTDSERENLRGELLRLYLESFVKEKLQDYKLKPYIREANPSTVIRVTTKHHTYYAVKFDNGVEVKCPRSIFMAAPVREEVTRLY